MNDNYFSYVVSNLAFEEVSILGILIDKDSTAPFKSITRESLLNSSGLTLARFRKVINNLTSSHLVEVVTGGKEHRMYITEYGMKAIQESLKEVEGL